MASVVVIQACDSRNPWASAPDSCLSYKSVTRVSNCCPIFLAQPNTKWASSSRSYSRRSGKDCRRFEQSLRDEEEEFARARMSLMMLMTHSCDTCCGLSRF